MNCRICNHTRFTDVIDLGRMPLVNNLLAAADQPFERWPLKVVACSDCSLAQLTETPPADAMFRDYLYFSSQSSTMLAHAGRLVERFVRPGQHVLEIASNDGYLLKHAIARGATVLGIDPARNIAAFANDHGVPTRCAYFDRQLAQQLAADRRADVVFANNVLAHVPDPNEIVAGIKLILAPQGTAHIEVPYLARMIETAAFDTIYHEHQCYFSMTALQRLFHQHDLRITAAELTEIHGGSLHLQVRHDGDETQAASFLQAEHNLGVTESSYYADFVRRVETVRCNLLAAIDRFDTVAAYGAAAKGVVLLNHFALDVERIAWVADISPHKQGRFIPGTLQPIVPPDRLLTEQPDACIILPWNIRREIIRDHQPYIEAGGRFIIPIPDVLVLPDLPEETSAARRHRAVPLAP